MDKSINLQTCLYGKLPAHGDFIQRNLPSSFVSLWDEWLQLFVSSSREQLGEQWLDTYLTSPIWRFCFSSGVIDGLCWAGIVMPSVDRVGRYFPLSVVKGVPSGASPLSVLVDAQDWFEQVEDHCLDALDNAKNADQLIDSIELLNFHRRQEYQSTEHLGENGAQVFGLAGTHADAIRQVLPHWLNATLAVTLPSFSVWHTSGSERVGPVLFCCQGLPPMNGIAAMLDGQWQQRNWKIPYNLQSTESA